MVSQDNRHLISTHFPIPGLTLPVAGRGGGSNTTHTLLNPDPETLPLGEGVAPSHRRPPGNQEAPRPTKSYCLVLPERQVSTPLLSQR